MDMKVIAELIKIVKADNDLYNKVKVMFDDECLDEVAIKELAEKAEAHGISVDSEDLADRFDSLINEGLNGININAMGGFDALIEMANGFLEE